MTAGAGPGRLRRGLAEAAASVLLAAALACAPAACSRPLPERGTAAANLYVARCGTGCHRPYHPGSMTAAMWRVQLDRMGPVITRAGQPPLTAHEKQQIWAYLERNAEGRVRPQN